MFTVIGIENVDYTNKQGKAVKGTKYHCTEDKNNVNGFSVETFYLPLDKDSGGISLGSLIEVLYNKYGNVSEIKIVG